MNWYKVKLKLKSWTASSWQADTIFGHLCWGMSYLYGERRLREFLHDYETGSPPLLVSNGFPGELLPRPVVTPPEIDPKLSLEKQREEFHQHKKSRDVRYLSKEDFGRALNSEAILPERLEPGAKRVTLKNQLNRLSGTTGEEGHLYNFEEYRWPEVSIYLKLVDDFVDEAERLFQYLRDTGYGKRKSVGYGEIEVTSFEPFDGFPSPAEPNGVVSLSNFVPASNDPVDGVWRIIVKYGKMGEEYALGENAFKKPLLMLEAGATFRDSPSREYYGRLVKGLSRAYPEVVQYAFALPVPMRLPE